MPHKISRKTSRKTSKKTSKKTAKKTSKKTSRKTLKKHNNLLGGTSEITINGGPAATHINLIENNKIINQLLLDYTSPGFIHFTREKTSATSKVTINVEPSDLKQIIPFKIEFKRLAFEALNKNIFQHKNQEEVKNKLNDILNYLT